MGRLQILCNSSVLASGYRGTGSIPAILINFFVFFYCRRGVGGWLWKVNKGRGKGRVWVFLGILKMIKRVITAVFSALDIKYT